MPPHPPTGRALWDRKRFGPSSLGGLFTLTKASVPSFLQVGNREIVINQTEPKQTVYIYNCSASTIQVGGWVVVWEWCEAECALGSCRRLPRPLLLCSPVCPALDPHYRHQHSHPRIHTHAHPYQCRCGAR